MMTGLNQKGRDNILNLYLSPSECLELEALAEAGTHRAARTDVGETGVVD